MFTSKARKIRQLEAARDALLEAYKAAAIDPEQRERFYILAELLADNLELIEETRGK